MNNKKRAPLLLAAALDADGSNNALTKRGKTKLDYAVNMIFIHSLLRWYHAAIEQDDPKRFTFGKALK